jgi:hypothetical protein
MVCVNLRENAYARDNLVEPLKLAHRMCNAFSFIWTSGGFHQEEDMRLCEDY